MRDGPGAIGRRALALGVPLLAALSGLAAAQQGPPTVEVARPERAEVVDRQQFPGRFQAVERVEVFARVSGYLTAVELREGETVEVGEPLFRIDPRPFEAAVAGAKARLAGAISREDLARLELQRLEKLLARDAVAVDDVDVQRATLDGAEADVAAARAALDAARLDLEYATLRAPIAGRVSSRNVDVGDLVRPGAQTDEPLTTIVSTAPIHFVFDISEADYLAFRRELWGDDPVTGTRVHVGLLDEDGFPHAGTLDFLDNRFDRATATLRLRARLDNADGLLLPGLFGRVEMAASRPYSALLVPDRAVLSDQGRKVVLVVDEAGKVTPRAVETGPLHDGRRVVRAGLGAEERVVVEGVLQARAAPRVRVSREGEGEGEGEAEDGERAGRGAR